MLTPGDLFAFSVEEDRGDGWSIAPSGRFRHSRDHLETLRDEHAFTAGSFDRAVLRHEGGEPYQGYIVVWSAGRIVTRDPSI